MRFIQFLREHSTTVLIISEIYNICVYLCIGDLDDIKKVFKKGDKK